MRRLIYEPIWKRIINKIFTTYNEITKYFDVKVAMDKNNKYHLELEKKQGGKGKISKLDLLIQQFSEFKDEMLKFKQNQEKFNEFVVEQFKQHGWTK